MAGEKLAVTGFVIHIGNEEQITASFKKRELIIETRDNPSYPETISFECHQDRVDLLDPYEFGDEVKVHFNLKGRTSQLRDGTHKNFNTLQAWRVEAIGATLAKKKANSPTMQNTTGSQDNTPPKEDDDLPF